MTINPKALAKEGKMQVNVTEFRPPNGERIERKAKVGDEHAALIEVLTQLGFSFAYERIHEQEVLYITHDAGDYRILFLSPAHGNAAGATTAILADVTRQDAVDWLEAQAHDH